jgi:hypothetical protein
VVLQAGGCPAVWAVAAGTGEWAAPVPGTTALTGAPADHLIDTLFAAPDNDEIGMTDAVPMLGREAQVSNEVLEVVYVDRRAQRHLRAKRPRPCAEPAEADRAP